MLISKVAYFFVFDSRQRTARSSLACSPRWFVFTHSIHIVYTAPSYSVFIISFASFQVELSFADGIDFDFEHLEVDRADSYWPTCCLILSYFRAHINILYLRVFAFLVIIFISVFRSTRAYTACKFFFFFFFFFFNECNRMNKGN